MIRRLFIKVTLKSILVVFILDVKISREKRKNFNTIKTRIGIYKNFRSHYFSLSSDFAKFHHKGDTLKSILYENSCTRDYFEKYFNKFPDKVLLPRVVVTGLKHLIITLPYFGKSSLQIRNKLNGLMENKLCYCIRGAVFQIKYFFFIFKNKISLLLCSTIVFKVQCIVSNVTYCFKVRSCKLFRNATLNEKRVKGMMILLQRYIPYPVTIYLILTISQ